MKSSASKLNTTVAEVNKFLTSLNNIVIPSTGETVQKAIGNILNNLQQIKDSASHDTKNSDADKYNTIMNSLMAMQASLEALNNSVSYTGGADADLLQFVNNCIQSLIANVDTPSTALNVIKNALSEVNGIQGAYLEVIGTDIGNFAIQQLSNTCAQSVFSNLKAVRTGNMYIANRGENTRADVSDIRFFDTTNSDYKNTLINVKATYANGTKCGVQLTMENIVNGLENGTIASISISDPISADLVKTMTAIGIQAKSGAKQKL